jgi:hypothetical protein
VTSPFAQRLRQAAIATGGTRPEMAVNMANSDLQDGDIQLAGGFVQALDSARLVRLARVSGARTNLSPIEQSQLDGINEPYADVNAAAPTADSRNWLERLADGASDVLANTGDFLSDHVLGPIGTVFNVALNVTKLPWRIASSAIDPNNDNEIDSAMLRGGYDVNSPWDYVQFMFNKGDELYHDLDPIRQQYGDTLVDLAVESQQDPEGFAGRVAKKPEDQQKLINSDDFARVSDLVDRQHISPGRDVARLVLPKGAEDTAGFTGLSGVLDGAYSIALDPTLLAGRVASGVKALDAAGNFVRPLGRFDRARGVTPLIRATDALTRGRLRTGIRDAADTEGIRNVLLGDTAARSTAEGFLADAKRLREAEDDVEAGSILARMRALYRPYMPFLDEVNGTRVLSPAEQQTVDSDASRLIGDLFDQPGVAGALAGGVGPTPVSRVEVGALIRPGGARSKALRVDKVELRPDGTYRLHGTRSIKGHSVPVRRKYDPDAQVEVLTPRPGTVIGEGPLPPSGETFDRKIVDVNGVGWLATAGKPIETIDDFANYMADTVGFLRFAGGAAAKREIMLPGRIALRSRAAAFNAEKRAQRHIYDHARPYTILPDESEEAAQAALDAAGEHGDEVFNQLRRGTASGQGWNPIRRQRAKWERRARRVSTLLPTVSRIDLTAADGTEQVRRFAALYMSKAESDRLASMYALADLGRRRQIVNGVIEQTFHASGLSRSETGLREIEKFHADQAALDLRAYGLNGTDVVKTEAGERHVALLPSQLSEQVTIPDFRSLQYLATKHVVGGHLRRAAGTFRAGFYGDGLDKLLHVVKLGWITSPAGGFRNALDEVAGQALTHGGSRLLRGRQLHSAATQADRAATLAERKQAASLEGRFLTRIPLGLRGLSNKVNDVLVANSLGKLLHYKADAELTKADYKYAAELAEDRKSDMLDDAITGTYLADSGPRVVTNDGALDLHREGIAAQQYGHSGENVKYEFKGYHQVQVDGNVGLQSWVDNLGQAFQDTTSPAHLVLRTILDGGDQYAAAERVAEYMHQPVMRHFRENAEVFKRTRDGRLANTAALQEDAIDHYAEKLTHHIYLLLTGRGEKIAADEAAGTAERWANDLATGVNVAEGPINRELADMLSRGEIPDTAWVKDTLDESEIPTHATAKLWAPVNPKHQIGKIAEGYTGLLTKAYGKVVTDQINALSRNPMMTAAYVQARHNTASYEKFLVKQGFDADVAEQMARRVARKQAEALVIKSIDNPHVASQFSILARNFWAFERAQEDWVRRWGRFVKDDPTVIRRAQLAIHGAESAGIVEKDDEGNLIFTYPGSGLVINAFNKLSGVFGVPMISVPVVPDLQSRVIFLNPSLDNPLGFSATPVVSIPFKIMAATVGADYPLLTSSLDKAVNGELGAGREWYENLLPGFVNRIIRGVLSDDPGSQFASAYTSALMNLEAAGRLDELVDQNDPTSVARFQSDLKAQIANQMTARALFGFFAPAAPGQPVNDVKDKNGDYVLTPDWSWHELGIKSLKDEARKVFADMPYEDALAYWQKVHPGELIYAQGEATRTNVGTEGATAFATVTAAKWMQQNDDFVQKYGGNGGVAAYFIPQGVAGTPGGTYSNVAYRAQLEQGIREYKTLDQFFNDIVINRAEAQYYETKDDYDDHIKQLIAQGNTIGADELEAQKKQELDLIKQANPLLAEKFALYATAGVKQEQRIAQLNDLLSDPAAVKTLGTESVGVARLLLAQREYDAARQSVFGKRGYTATTTREAAKAEYEAAVKEVTQDFPGLADLARGVFRTPDN